MRVHTLQIKIRNELILLNLLVVVLILAVSFFPSNVLRIILGIPFLLFFPGYILMAALFPRREQIHAVERVALSFGISITIVPLIGLILNYSPWGIRLEPVLYSVSSFILATSIIAWLRRRRLPGQEQLILTFRLGIPSWGMSAKERTLSVVLVFAILAAVGILGYVVATPKTTEKFTEFYILDTAGEMANYPQELILGVAGSVVVRIVNHERQDVTYRIEIRESAAIIKDVGPVKLQDKQKWEQKVDFVPISVGENQKVEFVLFKVGENEPYRSLRLWLDVSKGD